MIVTKDTNIYELIENYPEVEEVLKSHGLCCVGCPGSTMENIEQAAEGHNISLEELLKDIKKEIEK